MLARPTALRTLFSVVLLALVGCRSGGDDVPLIAGAGPAGGEDWFCQMGEDNGEWICIQDDDLAANPQPSRLPAPPPTDDPPADAAPAPSATIQPPLPGPSAALAPARPAAVELPLSGQPPRPPAEDRRSQPARRAAMPAAGVAALAPAPEPPPAAARAPARPPPTPPAAAPSQRPVQADLPLYQRLAYKPDKPTRLLDLPRTFYAVQLIAVSTKEALEDFVRATQLKGMAAARVERNGALYYVLLLGIYADRATAERAAASVPEDLVHGSPWVRNLGSLQDAMMRGDELAGTTEI